MKKAGRLLLVLFLLLSLNGCDTWDDWFDDDDDDDTTVEETTTTTDTTATTDTTTTTKKSDGGNLKFSHYNPGAWHGKGSAIVLCTNSPKMNGCKIDGTSLTQHGSLDKNRVVWTAYSTKGLSGKVKCFSGDTKYTTEVSGSSLQFGSCN